MKAFLKVILNGFLGVVVPVLTREAETLFPEPGRGDDKHYWVQGMVNNLVSSLVAKFHLPNWTEQIQAEIVEQVTYLIQAELRKIDP